MTIADEACANSIQCEMVKYAYRQTKDGVVVSFVVHPNDVPAALSTSPLGARYVAVLVQIGDDDLPVHQPAKETKQLSAHDSAPASRPVVDKPPVETKRTWQELQPAQQAGIRSGEVTFWAFLNETRKYRIENATEAAEAIRDICGVHSRAELGTDQRKCVLWTQLDHQYQAWLALEHA